MFSIFDKGVGSNDALSILFSEYLRILMAGLSGEDYVFQGCGVTAQGTPNMTVAVASGAVVTNGVLRVYAGGNGTITAADATNPRIDIVVITSSGTLAVRAGTPAANPKPPALTLNDVALAAVYVPANATAITDSPKMIMDLRVEGAHWPLAISLPTDHSNSTATLTEVTELSVPLPVGTYIFQYFLLHQSPALTTGARFSVNYTGTVTRFAYNRVFMDASAAAASAVPDQDQVLATGAILGGFAARAKSTLGLGTTLSVDVINADMLEIIEGVMVATTAGDIELWHGSETTAQNLLKAGSSLLLTRTG